MAMTLLFLLGDNIDNESMQVLQDYHYKLGEKIGFKKLIEQAMHPILHNRYLKWALFW